MIKKILSLSLVLSVMFFLSSCSQSFKLNEEIINQNIMHSYIEDDYNTITINHVSFTDAENSTFSNFTIEYQSQGLVILTNMTAEKAVYSIIEQKFLVDFGDQDITITPNSANGAYIYVSYADDTESVFDIKGTEIVPKDDYHTLNVTGFYSYIRNEYNQITEAINYERITTLTKTEIQDGKFTPTEKTYIVDFNTNTRTLAEETSDDTYNIGDKLGQETLNAMSLESYGLEGYYMTSINNIYRIYDENYELVSQFNIPTGSTVTANLMFDGKLLYQTQTKVPETEENYTFINTNQKYVLNTYIIDMLTGSIESIDFDYAIFSMSAFKDENRINKYAKVNVYPIESQILKVDALEHYILNSNGKILEDYDVVLNEQLIRLDDQTIYNQSTNTIYDNGLNPLFKVSSTAMIDKQEKLIITSHNNRLGVVNYQGEILIPFNYVNINPLFFNGYTMAYNASNEQVIIGIDGSEEKLDIYNTFDIPGVYIPFTYTNNYVFYDYQMQEIFSLSSSASSITTHAINHPTLNGFILDFNKTGAYEYVIIKYT
ncbi:hypothetical protein BK010_09325 [Tenericutes bacterium MO-XQ]|nr:hypothetical protein BK010_09325 [Tenericutes bacterium MO-XQ]